MSFFRKLTLIRQPILTVLTAGFSGMILLAVALVLYLSLTFTTSLIRDYHQLLINTALDNLNEEVEELLIPIESQAIWLRDQVEMGILDIDNYKQVEFFLRGAIGSLPNSTGGGILYPDGTGRYLVRDTNSWVEAKETTLEETQKFFNQMQEVETLSWGELFWFDKIQQTVFDIRVPLRIEGQLKGILVLGVTVAELSNSILKASTDQFLTPYILYDDEHLLAHPLLTIGSTVQYAQNDGVKWIRTETEDIPLPLIKGFQDTVLEELLFSDDYLEPRLITPTDDVDVKGQSIDHEFHIMANRTIQRFGTIPWTIGVYINVEKSEGTQAVELFRMAMAGVLVLIIAVIASVKVARKMARPIKRLADSAIAVRKGNMDDVDPLPRSRLKELDQASLAFNDMINGLKERDMIREVFGRYVPESVAASLMQENGQLEPLSTQATVLFSDIVRFTQLTEEIGPERIVKVLNQYFSRCVEILEKHGGVVTQFQGDAILATFNVPIVSNDHADNALTAALELQAMLKETSFDGIKLNSRIGINTGQVVAGAVGAEGRLNYTVHGDAVNMASRIENLNKEYETSLLISEHTAKLITKHHLRQIGSHQIRGHTHPVELYVT